MLRSIKILFVVLTVIGSFSAQARSVRITYSPYTGQPYTPDENNRVVFDAAPLLMNGVGFGYERTIARQWTLGPYVSILKFKPDTVTDRNQAQFTSDVGMYGIRGRYFIASEADESGFYATGGGGLVTVHTQGQFQNTAAGTNSSSAAGVLFGAGYQYVAPKMAAGKMSFNCGATYADGYAVSNEARMTYYGGNTEVSEPKALGSIFVEASIGYIF